MSKPYEILLDDRGELDELIVPGKVHLERMNDTQWDMWINLRGKKCLHLRFGAKNQSAECFMLVEDQDDNDLLAVRTA